MFKSKEKESNDNPRYQDIDILLSESDKFLKASVARNFNAKISSANASSELAEIVDNLNRAFNNYTSAFRHELASSHLATESMQFYIWEMPEAGSDALIPSNTCIWSQGFRNHLGYSNEAEFMNKFGSLIDILHPDDKQSFLNRLSKYVKDVTGTSNFVTEVRLRLKNKKYEYFQLSAQIKRVGIGVPAHMAGILRNINEEKLLLESQHRISANANLIAELNAMLQRVTQDELLEVKGHSYTLSPDEKEVMDIVNDILTNISDNNQTHLIKLDLISLTKKFGIFDITVDDIDLKNPSNKFIWSDEFRYIMGYGTERDFPNNMESWTKLIHPDDLKMVIGKLEAYVMDPSSTDSFYIEYRSKNKNEYYGTFAISGGSVRDELGRASRVIGILQNVSNETELKSENETLTMRMDLLQKSINIALWDMAIASTDPSNSDNEYWWSDEFRNMLGYNDEKDFPNCFDSWSNALHRDDKEKVLSAFTSHIMDRNGRIAFNENYRIKTKSGEYIWVKTKSATVRNSKGNPARVVGFIENITESMQGKSTEDHVDDFANEFASIMRQMSNLSNAVAELSEVQAKNLKAAVDSEKSIFDAITMVSEIKNIASETMILGTNASIEAARSGEAGRGFKVVSEEIGRLAEQSKKSVDQIEEKVNKVQSLGKNITEQIKASNSVVKSQTDLTERIKKALESLNDLHLKITELFQEK